MNKISKICGIFAVGTMMLSTFFVTSCNSEDDFDFGHDSQYSLAERKMTRAGETYQPITEGFPAAQGDTTIYNKSIEQFSFEIAVNWTRGFTGYGTPHSTASATFNVRDYEYITDDIINGKISHKLFLLYRNTYWEGNSIKIRQDYEIKRTYYYSGKLKDIVNATYELVVTPHLIPDSTLLDDIK